MVRAHSSVGTLERELQAHADPKKQSWWSNYVKGAEFYGVTMVDTRSIGLGWWQSTEHDDPVAEAVTLGHHPTTEIRLAGISIMERILIPDGTMGCLDLPLLRDAMSAGAFDDWNTCDWFCIKVLQQLMDGASIETHSEMLGWALADIVWVRRAALVAFVNLIPRAEPSAGFDTRFTTAASMVAEDQRRFCQTSIGWTMREMSIRNPLAVERFLTNHLQLLSREAISNASKKLDPQIRSGLLSAHRSL
jgi:3-methyladenine DNA glycosylase AlkD